MQVHVTTMYYIYILYSIKMVDGGAHKVLRS